MNTSTEKSWWQRHKIKVYVLGALMLVAPIAAVYMLRCSAPFQLALSKVQANADVVSRFGEPIRAGVFVRGQMRTSGSEGKANLAFPISGTKASGTVYVRALAEDGAWQLIGLAVIVDGTNERLMLANPSEAESARYAAVTSADD
jgi:cytochrome oxidase complex assembly protein 1